MSKEDEYKLLVGAYYGVKYLDEYELKEYLLLEIKKMIKDFASNNNIENYKEKEEIYEKELSKKTKLQDALIVLQNNNSPMEVVLLIRKHLKEKKINT